MSALGWRTADALGLSTASAHEPAGRIGALPSWIKPVDPAMTLAGAADPVRFPAGDKLFLYQAIDRASPGDILARRRAGETTLDIYALPDLPGAR